MTRCEEFSLTLPSVVDCAIIESEVNRRYFTEFLSSDGILVVTRQYAVLGVDGRYIEAAREKAVGVDVILVDSYTDFLCELLSKLGVKAAAIEGGTSVARLKALSMAMPGIQFDSLQVIDEAISGLRTVKSQVETEKIAEAQRLTDFAFNYITGYIRPGVTERDIALELECFMKRQGAERESFDTIVVSGRRTSMPHGVPTEKEIENGDFVTMDFGAVIDGYHSDMTRTIAVGHVDDEMKRVYHTVLSAQQAGIAALKPGIECKAVDKVCRDIIVQNGYGSYFTHSTGHGVGLEIHEYPNLSKLSEAELCTGNVVTVEPGIYLPGKFGVRIEDFAVITAASHRNFTMSSKELIIL